jgi:hypothetical protein
MFDKLDDVVLLIGTLALVVQIAVAMVQRAGLTRGTIYVAAVVGQLVAWGVQKGLLAQLGLVVTPVWLDWIFLGLAVSASAAGIDLGLKRLGAPQSSTPPGSK